VKFYGFISNGSTAALIDPWGSVDWLPLPRFDSPSVFTRMLGGDEAGSFAIVPRGTFTASQAYEEGTNILRTTLTCEDGKLEIVDFLSIGRSELRRLVRSDVPFAVRLRPRFGYGLVSPAISTDGTGVLMRNPLGQEALLFTIGGHGKQGVLAEDPLSGVWHLPKGRYDIILRYVGDSRRDLTETAAAVQQEALQAERDIASEEEHRTYRRNVQYWRDTARSTYRGPYRDAVERSLLVLRGLTYRTTGALIAAPTTSLPELPHGTRQWDYRFSWVRDGAYSAEALLAAGDHVAARRFIEFMLECVDLQGKPFQAPFFHVDGTLIRGERDLDWLRGFLDSRPCREGNAATGQLQLDIEGDFLWVVYRYIQETGDDESLAAWWQMIKAMVGWVEENWQAKDASLWEFRGQDAQYTHSKLMCWVALRYGAELAERIGEKAYAERWQAAAAAVHQAIEQHGFDQAAGHYTQAFDDGGKLDAALLMLPLYGYCDATDKRFAATLTAIERELVHGHWVYRYASDMLGTAAFPFVLSTSHLARVHIRRGEPERARDLLEGLVQSATDLGLLGEHCDMESGSPRGNFPQAFSHLGIVLAAIELEAAKGGS
jgi:GH15 family glucan-1,4-alpha-glucosidase